jgi:TRAP-type C4-dicarboxylate transport system permease small subunit
MTAKQLYQRAMEWLYVGCIALSGGALILITLFIPTGVFFRYVLNSPLSWPEPASIVLMVMFSFLGGAAVYRANVHIAVEALQKAVKPQVRRAMAAGVTLCMTAMALFMLYDGAKLCLATRFQTMAEFPVLSQGIVYMPIPIAGLLTLLFIVERLWIGAPPASSYMFHDQAAELE